MEGKKIRKNENTYNDVFSFVWSERKKKRKLRERLMIRDTNFLKKILLIQILNFSFLKSKQRVSVEFNGWKGFKVAETGLEVGGNNKDNVRFGDLGWRRWDVFLVIYNVLSKINIMTILGVTISNLSLDTSMASKTRLK